MTDDKIKIRPWVKPDLKKPENSFIGFKVSVPWDIAVRLVGKIFRRKKNVQPKTLPPPEKGPGGLD